MSQFVSSDANGKWLPKLFLCLQQYSRQDLVADCVAGVTVGLVALPLAMAFGIASGVTPQAGLYTAVVAGFLISALGGSRVQIGGPTGAFVVIVAGIIAKFGLSGLFMVTLMAGVLLIVMGITGFGAAVKFIPRPVTIGFTNGIALLIASTQLQDFLGLVTPTVPSDFIQRMKVLAQYFSSLDWAHGNDCNDVARCHSFLPAPDKKNSRIDRCALSRHLRRHRVSLAACHDRQQVRWHPHRTPVVCDARVSR